VPPSPARSRPLACPMRLPTRWDAAGRDCTPGISSTTPAPLTKALHALP
jgi:hypothetical protein